MFRITAEEKRMILRRRHRVSAIVNSKVMLELGFKEVGQEYVLALDKLVRIKVYRDFKKGTLLLGHSSYPLNFTWGVPQLIKQISSDLLMTDTDVWDDLLDMAYEEVEDENEDMDQDELDVEAERVAKEWSKTDSGYQAALTIAKNRKKYLSKIKPIVKKLLA